MDGYMSYKEPGIFTKLKMRLLTTPDPGRKDYGYIHPEQELIQTTHFSFRDRMRILLGSDVRIRQHFKVYPDGHLETNYTQTWIIR